MALVADANVMAKRLHAGDLAFIDPPYSGVQYSRFYHVLETIARGTSGDVSGAGRYPARELRPQSKFSLKTHSHAALHKLLTTVAERNATAILTFPDHDCSNGLSGEIVKEMAADLFHIKIKTVDSKFSTLGGNARMAETGKGRQARQLAKELILTLAPKKKTDGKKGRGIRKNIKFLTTEHYRMSPKSHKVPIAGQPMDSPHAGLAQSPITRPSNLIGQRLTKKRK